MERVAKGGWKRFFRCNRERSCYALVWSWNLIFAIMVAVWMIPVLLGIVNDASNNAVSWGFAVSFALIILFPLLFMGLALSWFRRKPLVLVKLFYGVEVPIFFLLIARVILLRDLNPGLLHLAINLVVALSGYFYLVVKQPTGQESSLANGVRLGLATLLLLTACYLAGLMLPFAPPWAAAIFQGLLELLKELPRMNFRDAFYLVHPVALLSLVLIGYTSTLFLALPFVMVYLYFRVFLAETQRAAARGWLGVTLVVLVVAGSDILTFNQVNHQEQPEVLALLKTIEEKPESQLDLLSQKDRIRAGLVNAYLGAYRYVSTRERSNAVLHAYKVAFALHGERWKSDSSQDSWLAQVSQNVFNFLARPFLYEGQSFREDQELASHYYQLLFDTPIEKAEREEILRTLEVTWEREAPAAGLINAVSRQVLLTKQEVTVAALGDRARVTIAQSMENQTFQQQEVVFHFSLPEEAVLTGLWLSDDPQQPEKFSYVVSPRGAAQQVYNAEVSRRVDPSLLEQVGPRQYRLRAFPVPARYYSHDIRPRRGRGYFDNVRSYQVEPLYLRFEYETTADNEGNWPLPSLLEKRNVYWEDTTSLTVNGQTTNRSEDDWLPRQVAGLSGSDRSTRRAGQVILGNTLISVIPRQDGERKPKAASAAVLLAEQPLAVIVDGSYSMRTRTVEVKAALARLADLKINHRLYLCQASCQEISAVEEDWPTYGNSQVAEQLASWQSLVAEPNRFGAVLLLTDAGSYELEKDVALTMGVLPPLWLIHLGGAMPYAYNDQLLALLKQSQGGIAESVDEALGNFALRASTPDLQGGLFAVTEHYLWYAKVRSDGDEGLAESPLAGIAARQWLDYLARTRNTRDLAVLDQLHDLAKQYHMVTDYSSMIVLVEERQRQLLAEAEAREDRFQREIETGREQLTTPEETFTVSAVPEPHEWLLLAIVGLLLMISAIRSRTNFGKTMSR